MIEVGKLYKLKPIDGVGSCTSDCKIEDIITIQSGQKFAVYTIVDTGEKYMAPDWAFLPADSKEVFEKLQTVMRPMNATFWKNLSEEGGTCMAGMGTAPCPAMGQITSGGISGATVNGVPVEGKSVKKKNKKKSKKNEDLPDYYQNAVTAYEYGNLHYDSMKDLEHEINVELDRLTRDVERPVPPKALRYSPEKVFKDDVETPLEFEDALNILLFGQDASDKKEYNNLLKLFKRTGKLAQFKSYAQEKGITDLTGNQIGAHIREDLEDETDMEARSLITQAQGEENDAIHSYLQKALQCREFNLPELEKLFKELASDETEHTGCLQAALDLLNLGDEQSFVNGHEEGAEIIHTNVVNDKIEQQVEALLNEDFNEAYERITDLIAKQLDKMNFEFANTNDIIYKKEGDYKYLFKFDNELGIIKIKVSKDEDILEEKEWQLDEEDDVQPIFNEIEAIYGKYGI